MSPSKLDALVEHAAKALVDERSPTEVDEGRRRLLAKVRAPARAPKYGLLAVAAALAAAAAFVVLRPVPEPATITFTTDGPASGGWVRVPADVPARHLHFSDGSDLALGAGAVGRVDGQTPNGARVTLERGSLQCDIVHAAHTSWTVSAGPYQVRVKGTRFDVEFSPEDGGIEVRLVEGAVVVVGPSFDGGIDVRAGQRLRASAGKVEIDDGERPAPSAASVPAPPLIAPRDAAPAVAHPTVSAKPSWSELVAQGENQRVLELAEADGIETSLATRSADDLMALADASRYAKRTDLAQLAYRRLRSRFPSSPLAHDAAFFLGKLTEPTDPRAAADWYATYRAEVGKGAYSEEALGREMVAIAPSDRARAKLLAAEILRDHPNGPFARVATSIEAQP